MLEILHVLVLITHLGSPEQVHEACMEATNSPLEEDTVCAAFATLNKGVCFIRLPDKDKVPLDFYIELLGHELVHCAGWEHGLEYGKDTKWTGGF